MPSWPRLEPTNGARPCLTRMCMRSSSALAMHIHRCSWRYSSLVAVSALVAEDVGPEAWLGRLDRHPAHLLEVAGQRAQLLVLEIRDLDPEQVAELQQHLVHRRVAGALADAVDARGEDLRPAPQRHHRVP